MRLHRKTGITSAQLLGEVRCHAGLGAQQEHAPSPPSTHGRQRWDEVDAGDRSTHRAALAPRGPDHARSIGQAEVRAPQDAGELSIAARAHDELRIHGGHEMMASGVRKRLDALQCGLHVDAVDTDSEDMGLGRVHAD